MYKKEIFRNIDKKYNSRLYYTDLQGFFMKYGHKVLEFALNQRKVLKIDNK